MTTINRRDALAAALGVGLAGAVRPAQAMSPALAQILLARPPLVMPAQSSLMLWLEASDLSTQFQSNAGTTAVSADGDPVGYWADKSPANFGAFISAADDTTRPTHRIRNGVRSVAYDGSNDALRKAASLGMYAQGSITVMVALRAYGTGGGPFISEGYNAADAPIYEPARAAFADTNDYSFGINNDAATAVANMPVLIDEAFVGGDYVMFNTDTGSSVIPEMNGVQGVPQTYTRSGTLNNLNRTGIGCNCKNATPSPAGANDYYVIAVWSGQRTVAEKRQAYRYALKKMGY